MKIQYGLQMYSVRDSVQESMKDTLEKVSKLGYKHIEFAGFFGNKAEDVKAWLDEFGLECSGTHTGMDAISPENIDETIVYHKTIGCKHLIVPGCDWGSVEKCDGVIEALNWAQKKLAENDIALGYHNHSREFFPTADGIVFEDEVIARTSVELEIDTFWAFNAGLDVIDYLEKNKSRISVIHLKDGIPSADEDKNIDCVHNNVTGLSVGSGKAPVEAVRKWAIENDVLMVIESEGLDPTGIEEVGRCIEFLKGLE